MHQAVRQACAAAGITPQQLERVCIGAAGGARPEISASVAKMLAEVLDKQITVVTDTEIALEAAFGSGPGVIVIGGTGSIAYGREAHGKTARAGGWGFAISDEGSAHWVGREIVARILHALDRTWSRENFLHQKLVTDLCPVWKLKSVVDLARAANSIPPPDFAALFPVVVASEDALAKEVLSCAGKQLADMAAIVTRRLFSDAVTTVPVALIGGVFRHSTLVRGDFYNQLRRLDPRVEINPQIIEPVQGALQMARKRHSSAT
jgi:glucosamine kinase